MSRYDDTAIDQLIWEAIGIESLNCCKSGGR